MVKTKSRIIAENKYSAAQLDITGLLQEVKVSNLCYVAGHHQKTAIISFYTLNSLMYIKVQFCSESCLIEKMFYTTWLASDIKTHYVVTKKLILEVSMLATDLEVHARTLLLAFSLHPLPTTCVPVNTPPYSVLYMYYICHSNVLRNSKNVSVKSRDFSLPMTIHLWRVK